MKTKESKNQSQVLYLSPVPGYNNRKLIKSGSCPECYRGQGQYHEPGCSLDKSKC